MLFIKEENPNTHTTQETTEREKAHENEMARNKNNRKKESKMELLYGR